MQCYVYKSARKFDTYLYLCKRDDFDVLPPSLLEIFGKPVFALEFDLTPVRKLAKEDTTIVISNLNTQGFHLQLPPDDAQQTP